MEQLAVEFRVADAGVEPAASLIAATLAAGRQAYGRIPAESRAAPAMVPPYGAFLVGFDRERAIACGGLTCVDESTAELKRMYVAPEARRRGVGRALLDALEHEARRLGYTRIRLDTGPRQLPARTLYESAGYVATCAYNDDPIADFWGEKRL